MQVFMQVNIPTPSHIGLQTVFVPADPDPYTSVAELIKYIDGDAVQVDDTVIIG
jgi:hypothetical protein